MRICLGLAIIAGLAVGVVNFVMVRDKINATITERNDFSDKWHKETDLYVKTDHKLKETVIELDRTNALLVSTAKERDDAVAKADEQQKRADDLATKLDNTTKERNAAQDELAAWKALGVPLESIRKTLASLKDAIEAREALTEENRLLVAKVQKQQGYIDSIINPDHEPEMPANLQGKVLVTDPRFDFVVLSVGEKQGATENGRLLVSHNGKLVAKLKIKSVQVDRSIANVMPGWKFSDIMEGDDVIASRPKTF